MCMISNEWQFFKKILKLSAHHSFAATITDAECASCSSKKFLSYVDKHRVAPIFYHIIYEKLTPNQRIKNAIFLAPLKQRTLKITQRYLKQKLALQQLCAAFEH